LILTLTINPAIDRNVNADKLVFEDRGYILTTSESAGGRGINASRVIHSFGGETLAIVTSGGASGSHFEGLLDQTGVPFEVVRIAREMRTNLNISDKHGLTVKLNEVGPAIGKKELDQVEKVVSRRLGKAAWLMICGSVPPGVATTFYRTLIEVASKKNVQTLLDSDGEALLHGIEAKPTVVTPNQQEAERLLNRALITRQHFFEAAQRIHGMGAETVLLSLGSRGMVAKNSSDMYEVVPPRIDAVSPIGAGDAMAAAYVWAMANKKTFTDAIRWSVAAGTAAAKLPGLSYPNLEQTKEVYKDVEVRPVNS
jgi:1-phosphofructokinase family hexose kinase